MILIVAIVVDMKSVNGAWVQQPWSSNTGCKSVPASVSTSYCGDIPGTHSSMGATCYCSGGFSMWLNRGRRYTYDTSNIGSNACEYLLNGASSASCSYALTC